MHRIKITVVVIASIALAGCTSTGQGEKQTGGAVVGAGVYLGHDSRLGAGTRVFPNAVIYHDVHVGEHCVIHSQAVLGGDGFGFAPGPGGLA